MISAMPQPLLQKRMCTMCTVYHILQQKKITNQAYQFAGEDVLVLMFLDLTDQDWFLRKECITLLIILLSAQK